MEYGFQYWRSEENDGTEILGFLEQQLPSELVPTQLPVRELSQKWVAEFENLGIKEENTWHTPKDDGADVLNFLHSPEFPNNLMPDSIENRSDVHEKWYQEFERLNFGVDTGQGDSISEDDLPLEQTLNEWEKEFNLDTHGSQAHYDIDAFRDGPIKEYEALSSSVESTPLPYTPTQDVGYHDPRMDGQEVLEFLNHALYSEEVSEDYSDPANLTSKRQSQYQSLSKPVDRKFTSDILEYLVCIPYTDEVYGSYDFSWIDTRVDTKTKPTDASVPNQYESALQRLRLLKKHLTPST
ncbi:hypothetical protein K7432_012356 [Basidiobolus ranarum]|uniref:Uncharacterized protein n=1 Tax=Basidiobolus ranarum TaxID=34480 RepID=A0ABR2WL00_9FUNG